MAYKEFSQVVFRFPQKPFNYLNSILNSGLSISPFIKDLEVQQSIYLASPVLYNELKKISEGKITKINELNRILISLERYLSRMSTRCTPFGLFAGCAIGKVDKETRVFLERTMHKTTRLDMYFLCTLYDSLMNLPEVKDKLTYYSNTSLYQIKNNYRYIEYQYVNGKRKYRIAQIEGNNYLKNILKLAQKGNSISAFISYLQKFGISEEEARNYIDELIGSQVIIGELSHAVTGDDFFSRLIKMGEKCNIPLSIQKLLKEIDYILKHIDNEDGSNISLYHEIISKIENLHVPYEEKYLFQVDMLKETSECKVGEGIIKELKSTMNFLNKITNNSRNELLYEFQQDFYNRYEEREVPLMHALDPEIGIGYPARNDRGDISPLLDNFYLPQKMFPYTTTYHFFQSLLLKKILECFSQKAQEIIFTDEDVKDIPVNWESLPPTLYTIFSIIRAHKDDVLINLKSCGGSCAANLLARFAHTSQKIESLVKKITVKEQELVKDAILAEIVHLPEARIGNILSRPHIREYELLYMSTSDLPSNQLLHLSDLTLSVREGRLVIRSKKMKKEIIPRLTTAHNYSFNSMPVYRFLCDMQIQHQRSGLFFSWGHLGNEFSFLPRVRYKNTILSPATWTVKNKEIKHLFDMKDDDLILETTKWRKEISLPQYSVMPDGDNELFVDWNSAISIQALFSIIKHREVIKFTEFLFEEEKAVAKGEGGAYLNECIVTFYKD